MPNPKDTLSLVERLRERAAISRGEKPGTNSAYGDAHHFEEAADEIERLSKELDEATEAVQTLDQAVNVLNDRSQGGVPEGYVLVPVEPTPEMARCLEENFAECLPASTVHVANWRDAYRAMLSAAPQPPVLCRVGVTEGEGNNGSLAKNGVAACNRPLVAEEASADPDDVTPSPAPVQPPEGGTGSPVVQIIPPSGLVEGPGWQVIETAPADGTEVILFYPHATQDGFVTAGYYYRDGGDGPYWYADLVNGYASPPTHWMPLPSPPGQDDMKALVEAEAASVEATP